MEKLTKKELDLNVGQYEVRIKSRSEPDPEEEYGFSLTVATFEKLNWKDCDSIIEEVAVREKGWPVQLLPEQYKDRSVFVVAYDGSLIVGIAMIITGDPKTFPIRDRGAWPNLALPMGSSAEIPFVLVKNEYRGSSGVSYKLCACCYWYFVEKKIDFVELTLDRRLWQFYQMHGMKMTPITQDKGGGIKTHWDEPGIFPARLYVGTPEEDGSWGFGVKNSFPGLWKIFLDLKPNDLLIT